GARAFQDSSAVGEQMRHDVRTLDAGVFRLHMEDPPLVLDVVIEADEGGRRLSHTPRSELSGYHTMLLPDSRLAFQPIWSPGRSVFLVFLVPAAAPLRRLFP